MAKLLCKKINRQKGLSILGVMVAVFIVAAGLVAVLALLNMTLRVAQANKQKIIAYFLVQEGLEIIHNLRDTNWLQEDAAIPWNLGMTDAEKYGTVNYNSQIDYKSTTRNAFFQTFHASWSSIDKCIFEYGNTPEISPCRLYLSDWLPPGEIYMGGLGPFSRYTHVPADSAPTNFYRIIIIKKVVPVANKERISVLSQVKWIDNNKVWQLMQAEELLWNWY